MSTLGQDSTGGRTHHYAPGEFLFRQNDNSHELFVIKSGQVKLFKSEGGVEIDLETVGVGSVVGEVAAIDGGRRSASGVAVQATEVYTVSRSEFGKIMDKIPDWYCKIARILVQRLREVDAKIDNSTGGDRTRQMAVLLAMICYGKNCKSLGEGSYSLSQKFLEDELIDLMSIRLNDTIEHLADLAEKDLVTFEQNRVVVKDRAELEKFGRTVFDQREETVAT